MSDLTPWREQAACRGLAALFDRTVDEPNRRSSAVEAAEVCRDCPVTAECIAAGKGEWGVWGGLTAQQRGLKIRPNYYLVRSA